MRRFFAVALLALFSAFPSLQAQTAQAVAASARFSGYGNTQPSQLSGYLPKYVSAAEVTSEPVASDLQLQNLTLVLTRSPQVQAAFEQLLQDQLNPSSPRYHQWLTPQQVGELYGPAQSDVDAVTNWLKSEGLTVTDVAPSRIFINFSGSAENIGRVFSTSFRNYHLLDGEVRYSLTQEPSLPASIAPLVKTIHGLVQGSYYSQAKHGELLPASLLPGGQQGNSTFLSPQLNASSGAHYLISGDFAIAYNVKAAYQAGYDGTGQKIAIVGRNRVNPTDVTVLQSIEGQPSKLPNEIIPSNGTDPGAAKTTCTITGCPGNGDQDEQTLDVNRTNGTAPGATIDLVVSAKTGLNDGLILAMQYAIGTVNDPILSISYGGCESLNGSANTLGFDSLYQVGASQGISIFVSSGDDGAAGCNAAYSSIPATQVASINALCSSSYVTCVGGTEFVDPTPSIYWASTNSSTNNSSILSYIPEGAWNDISVSSGVYSEGGTGGGVSTFIAKPAWQTGTGVPAGSFRWVPDMSFTSSTHDGFVTCLAYRNATCGSFYSFGGTSAAAPSMAGVQAIANQKLGGRQGNINPKLYSLAATPSNNVFHDTTVASSGVSGCVVTTPSLCNNSTPTSSSLTGGLSGYLVTAGWDAATGWGSIDVNNYLTALSTVSLATPTVAVTLTPSTIVAGGTTSMKATVTGTSGTPTGTVQFQSNGANIGSAATLASGIATVTSPAFNTPGNYSITAVYSGDSSFATATSSASTLTVTGVSTTTTLAPATGTYVAKQTVTLTATVAGAGGTPTGTVTFKDGSSTLSSTALTAGVATLPVSTLTAGTHTITATYSGDTTYSPSTSNNSVLTITAIPTTTTLQVGSTSITANQALTLTATVAGAGGPPTGSVQFKDGTTLLGSGTLSSGTASYTVAANTLSVATHSITAAYQGDSYFATSTSAASNVVVAAAPSFSLTATPASVTLTAGAASGNISTISATGANGFSGTAAISLSCSITSSASIAPTCSVSPASITTSTTATVTLTTIAPHAVGTQVSSLRRGVTGMCVLLLLGVPFAIRRRRFASLLSILLLTALALGANGCGGNKGQEGPSGGTTKGTYTVVVTGTSTGAATQTTNITLTVN